MNLRPFPKPVPAEPLDEAVWLDQTDRAEVVREPFFCGRDAEYEVFQKAAASLLSGRVGGGTVIFQGAPGAGKSALMQECMEAVRQHSTPQEPWVAVSVSASSLKSSLEVIAALVDAADAESRRLSRLSSSASKLEPLSNLGKRLYDELSQRDFSLAGVAVGGKSQTESDADVLPAGLFRHAAPLLEDFRFVVFVDEAQNTPVHEMTKAVLDCLHRDPHGIHLVAAFFGLSGTEEVLGECGLSRLGRGRVVNLEPLSKNQSKGSFTRMLNAYHRGTREEKSFWAEALTDLSQGWPQHINRVGVAAGHVLSSNGRVLKRVLLDRVLELGVEQKNKYYAQRLEAGRFPPWVYKQIALKAEKNQGQLAGIVTFEEVDSLTESARKNENQTAGELVESALYAGLLAPVAGLPFHYCFPIPSLGDYLRALPVALPDSA